MSDIAFRGRFLVFDRCQPDHFSILGCLVRSKVSALVALVVTLSFWSSTAVAQVKAQNKPIPVAVKVDAEGGGKAQGMWTQSAKDLTPKEVQILQSLIVAEIKKQDGIQIVPLTYPEEFVGVAVVGAKLPNSKGGAWYVTSSAIILSLKNATDEFVTHNVEAGPSLSSVATTIAYEFASARFAAAAGIGH